MVPWPIAPAAAGSYGSPMTHTVADERPLIALRNVYRTYAAAAAAFTALDDVTFDVARGELVVVVGQSGSGKSTLMNLLSGVDRPTSGEVIVGGIGVHALSERQASAW